MPDDFLPTFTAIPNELMPEDYCAVFVDDQIVYAGPINRCPMPEGGSVMYLNPVDHAHIDRCMKKYKH